MDNPNSPGNEADSLDRLICGERIDDLENWVGTLFQEREDPLDKFAKHPLLLGRWCSYVLGCEPHLIRLWISKKVEEADHCDSSSIETFEHSEHLVVLACDGIEFPGANDYLGPIKSLFSELRTRSAKSKHLESREVAAQIEPILASFEKSLSRFFIHRSPGYVWYKLGSQLGNLIRYGARARYESATGLLAAIEGMPVAESEIVPGLSAARAVLFKWTTDEDHDKLGDFLARRFALRSSKEDYGPIFALWKLDISIQNTLLGICDNEEAMSETGTLSKSEAQEEGVKPHWNPVDKKLTYPNRKPHTVKIFQGRDVIGLILTAFQNQNWPETIENPVPGSLQSVKQKKRNQRAYSATSTFSKNCPFMTIRVVGNQILWKPKS